MKKLARKLALPLALAGVSLHAAHAGDLSGLGSLTATEFHDLSTDLGAVLSYKPILPTTDQGVTGFDIGVAGTSTSLSNSAALKKAGADVTGDALQTLGVHVHKGLPAGFDIGGFIATVPALDARLVGGELRYALLQGSLALPTIGVRGTFTHLNGSEQLTFNTRSLDISVSKGISFFTPYAGVGRVWVDSEAQVGGLGREQLGLSKVYAGASLAMGPLINLTFEVDKTGDNTTWGGKFGLRW